MFIPKKISLIPIFLTVFIDLVGLGIIIPILAPIFVSPYSGFLPITTPFAERTLYLGFLIAMYPIAQFFGAPILGALSDRHGRKKLLIISLTGTLIGYLLFGIGILTKNIFVLFFSRIIDGFTGGNISIAMSSIADISDAQTKARNFGLIGMAFGLGFILGPFIGGSLADPTIISWFNAATPFWFASLLTISNILLVIRNFTETLEHHRHTPVSALTGFKNIAKALRMSHLRILFLVVFLFTFGFNFFTQFFQVFLVSKFSFTLSQIGNELAYIGIWIAFAQGIIIRPLSKIFSPSQILSFSLFALGITFPILLLPHTAYILFFILPFVAIFNGLSQPNTTAIISNAAGSESQGEILGINQSIQSAGQALPPIIAGIIVSINRNLPILIAGGSIILAWAVFMFIYKPSRQKFHEI